MQVLAPESLIPKKEEYIIILAVHGRAREVISSQLNMLGLVEWRDFFVAERVLPGVMHG